MRASLHLIVAVSLCAPPARAIAQVGGPGAVDPAGVAAPAAPVDASTREALFDALEFAENAFVYGDYPDVVARLEPVLTGTPAVDERDADAWKRAYSLLGIAAHFTGRGPLADAAFLELLRLDPRERLDPLVVPPRVIERFEAVRDAHAEELDLRIGASGPAATIYVQREVHEQSPLVSALPFGIGFLASDRPGPGTGYLVTEAVTGGVMAGLYLASEVSRDAQGFTANAVRAERRGTAQIAIASVFTALVVANVAHGLATHDRSARIEYRTLTEPPAELGPTEPASLGWELRMGPWSHRVTPPRSRRR